MSEFIQVGVTAMRDPKTGELLNQVPLYVEVIDGEEPELPEFDRKQFARDFMMKFRSQLSEKAKKTCCREAAGSGRPSEMNRKEITYEL